MTNEDSNTKHRHFILHKPQRYLSQFINNQNKRKNKKMLGGFHDFPEGIMAIGRLDENSEGLLFLTTDGMVSQQVRSKKVEKEYYVQVDGDITDEAIEQLQTGVEITVNKEKYLTLPGKAKKIEIDHSYPFGTERVRSENHGPESWFSIIISEGKYRQVRKMSAAVGFPVLRLVRVRIGGIEVFDIPAGNVVEVDDFNGSKE